MRTSSFLALLVLLCGACSGGSGGSSAATGTERGPCYGNGTCDVGLVCASDTCVALAANAGGANGGSGGLGGSAGPGGQGDTQQDAGAVQGADAAIDASSASMQDASVDADGGVDSGTDEVDASLIPECTQAVDCPPCPEASWLRCCGAASQCGCFATDANGDTYCAVK